MTIVLMVCIGTYFKAYPNLQTYNRSFSFYKIVPFQHYVTKHDHSQSFTTIMVKKSMWKGVCQHAQHHSHYFYITFQANRGVCWLTHQPVSDPDLQLQSKAYISMTHDYSQSVTTITVQKSMWKGVCQHAQHHSQYFYITFQSNRGVCWLSH
jgi:hypothetical protein